MLVPVGGAATVSVRLQGALRLPPSFLWRAGRSFQREAGTHSAQDTKLAQGLLNRG